MNGTERIDAEEYEDRQNATTIPLLKSPISDNAEFIERCYASLLWELLYYESRNGPMKMCGWQARKRRRLQDLI